MKTGNQLITELYPYFNGDVDLTNLITGEVFRDSRPEDMSTGKPRELNDLVIFETVNSNSRIQEITVMFNYYAKDIAPGVMDDSSLTEVEEKLIEILEGLDGNGFSLTLATSIRTPDADRKGWAFLNTRVVFEVYNQNFKT